MTAKKTRAIKKGTKARTTSESTSCAKTHARKRVNVRTASVAAALSAVVFVAAGSLGAWSCSKDHASSSSPAGSVAARSNLLPPGVETTVPPVEGAKADAGIADATPAPDPDAPWEGPWIGAKVATAPVYSAMRRAREHMIGYLRYGSKAPAADITPAKAKNCTDGWYRLHPYGYICGEHGTPNLKDERFRAGTTPPDYESIVPYKYAYNRRNGTPLYRSIPTSAEQDVYEPDRDRPKMSKSAKRGTKSKRRSQDDARTSGGDGAVPRPGATGTDESSAVRVIRAALDDDLAELSPLPPAVTARVDGGLLPLPEVEHDAGLLDAEADAQPWWMRPDAGEDEITLDDMTTGADEMLAKRMARGFFVAIDKSFRKNGRYWYKTTEGLIAPADRMSINSPPKFQGVELVGNTAPSLPIGWVSVKAVKYDLENGNFEKGGTVERFTMVPMTDKIVKKGQTTYRRSMEGFWLKAGQVRVTDPGAPPSDLRPNERWIDVDIGTQTLVAFEGTKPIYATMVSSGKKGQTKESDHSTVVGRFRVREKHVAATMDGDGAGPGEGPYSIQDVPYVMYFERSYAIHGAFWHNNFGTRMSHGCVNLAPLDARRLFFWSDPQIPRGWHGAWSSRETPGSYVVVHD